MIWDEHFFSKSSIELKPYTHEFLFPLMTRYTQPFCTFAHFMPLYANDTNKYTITYHGLTWPKCAARTDPRSSGGFL
ncbi:hypothetical protein BJY04DRAFT_195294 [Aspergillus karnatakaensis]|uniref:uncharacterized protein n=1 Tax=Aspergillus karnatakaensis TaxID=1810916 RepID=UPI003CCD1B6F